MLSIIGNRKIIVSMLTMVFLIVGVQGISYAQAAPPLVVIVDPLGVDPASVAPGGSFTLTATVENSGAVQAPGTINEVQFYKSTNNIIFSDDTPVGRVTVGALGAGDESTVSISMPAPSTVGTHYYGASVRAGPNGLIDYSTAVTLTVTNVRPNLTVDIDPYYYYDPTNPYGLYNPVAPGGRFTLNATVRNVGDGASAESSSLRIEYRAATTSIWSAVAPTSIISIQPSCSSAPWPECLT